MHHVAFKADDTPVTSTMLFHALHGLVHDSVTGKRPNRQRLMSRGKVFFRRAVEADALIGTGV